MLKVVVDTNIFVAGYLSRNKSGYPSQILAMWRAGAFNLVMSPLILQEVVAKLLEKGVDEELIEEFVFVFGHIGLYIPGAYHTSRLDKIDPDDNMFLAAALESYADYIVSYDANSLLPMKHFHGTQVVSAELLIRQLMGLATEERSDKPPHADLEPKSTP